MIYFFQNLESLRLELNIILDSLEIRSLTFFRSFSYSFAEEFFLLNLEFYPEVDLVSFAKPLK